MKSELRKQQLTVSLSDCNRLALLMVLWKIQNFICYCTVFALFYFVFEGNFQVQAPGDLYSERPRFTGGFFALRVWRLIFGGAYFRNFTVAVSYLPWSQTFFFKRERAAQSADLRPYSSSSI